MFLGALVSDILQECGFADQLPKHMYEGAVVLTVWTSQSTFLKRDLRNSKSASACELWYLLEVFIWVIDMVVHPDKLQKIQKMCFKTKIRNRRSYEKTKIYNFLSTIRTALVDYQGTFLIRYKQYMNYVKTPLFRFPVVFSRPRRQLFQD